MIGEWRCSWCHEPVNEAIPASDLGITEEAHAKCGNILPGAYWVTDINSPVQKAKFYFSLLFALMFGVQVANAAAPVAPNITVSDWTVSVTNPSGSTATGGWIRLYPFTESGVEIQLNDPVSGGPFPRSLDLTPYFNEADTASRIDVEACAQNFDGWTCTSIANRISVPRTASTCEPVTGVGLECPGHGRIVRCEIPSDAQAATDRQILLTLYINDRFVNYPSTQQFPLDGAVYQDWAVQPTDDIYWGVCVNHMLVNSCSAQGEPAADCLPDAISLPMELGYLDGQPLPEAGSTLMILTGLALLLVLSYKRKKFSSDQERVAKYWVERTGIGAGEDPIGNLICSHRTLGDFHSKMCDMSDEGNQLVQRAIDIYWNSGVNNFRDAVELAEGEMYDNVH